MFYTREQIEKLEKYRKTFETAVHSGFARNVGSIALKEIEEVYDEAFGSHYSYNSGCSVCVLGFIKRVGEPFLKEAEKYKRTDELEKKLNEGSFPPAVEMKDGGLSFNFERALAEEELIKAKAEQEADTNTSEPPKTNKRGRKKKVQENGTE